MRYVYEQYNSPYVGMGENGKGVHTCTIHVAYIHIHLHEISTTGIYYGIRNLESSEVMIML